MNQKQKGTEKTKGQLEAEISEAIIKFEKEYMGRGPTETKTYIIDDLVLVRLKGILTSGGISACQDRGQSQGAGADQAGSPRIARKRAPAAGGRHARLDRPKDGQPTYRHQHSHRRTGNHLHVGCPRRIRPPRER